MIPPGATHFYSGLVNIAHITRRFAEDAWGGTETVVLETSKRLQSLGHDAAVYTTTALAAERHTTIHQVPVHRYPYFYPYLGLSNSARAALDRKAGNLFSFSLARRLANTPADVFHLHTGKRLGGIARHAARGRRVPYVVSLHGGAFDVPAAESASWTAPTRGAFEWGKALGWWVGSRHVMRDAAAVICLSDAERAAVKIHHPDVQTVVLPNGVDTRRFRSGNGAAFRAEHGIRPDAKVVLTMGRIDPQKQQHLAVEAIAQLRAQDIDAHLVLIGPVTDQAYGEALTRTVAERGLTAHVTRIDGLRSGDPALVNAYHAAQAFLLPSLHEPFGIVALEAWAAGCPVVASRVGGIPGFATHMRNAFLFNPGDVAHAVTGLTSVLLHPTLGRTLAEAGRRRAADRFDWTKVTEDLVTLYEDVRRAHPVR